MRAATPLPTLPSETEAILAKETSRVLAARQHRCDPLSLRLLDAPGKETAELPAAAVRLLVRILEEMARGNTVTLIPVHAELTHARGGRLAEYLAAVADTTPRRGGN